MNGMKADTQFAIILHISRNPIALLSTVLLVSFLFFGVGFYIAEIGVRASGTFNRFENFSNSLWVSA